MIETSTSEQCTSSGWLAALRCPGSAVPPAGGGLHLLEPFRTSPTLSESPRGRVIFDGVLYNRTELQALVADPLHGAPTDADLVSQAYWRWGEDAIGRLKGIFALIIEDLQRGWLLCARDPLGIRPLFHAELPGALLLSPSVETLRGHPGVSAELNRACLVDRLTGIWPAGEETYFAHVRRVPPGHIMRITSHDRRVYRYWNPLPAGTTQWIPDDEVQERFESVLEQAVTRCLAPDRAAIYLSGGLDSSMIAMVVADLSRERGWAPPCALSLVFAEVDRDESARQHGLAAALGVSQIQLPVEDAAGPEGTLRAALAMTRRMPAPLTVIWRPALERLALLGRERGCRVVLAGDGADEWLWVNTVLAADLLRSLNLGDLQRLWRLYARSYHFSSRHAFRLVIWHSAVKRLLRDACYAAAGRLGLQQLVRRRWHSAAVRTAAVLGWVAPDPTLRARVVERLEASYSSNEIGPGPDGYYLRDTRARLEAADKWFREEETFLVGQQTGLPVREPFWDPDLIEFLVRVRPQARSADGLAKALVRRPLAARYPALGFGRQRKSNLGVAYVSVLKTQASAARRAIGEFPTLVELGVIDREGVRALLDDGLGESDYMERLGWTWPLLNLEAWARAHR